MSSSFLTSAVLRRGPVNRAKEDGDEEPLREASQVGLL
jgi:hypothetical protein